MSSISFSNNQKIKDLEVSFFKVQNKDNAIYTKCLYIKSDYMKYHLEFETIRR